MMWCTRWFLPLLLLPLPTAPPYFLVLFVFSFTLLAKPCFYCIVLLTTLFVSSCYWQPFPLDNPLTTPWSQNITTFADALKTSLPANSTPAFPSVMRAVDRCWCDFTGSFFESFNVSHWEYLSVLKVSQDLERKRRNAVTPDAVSTNKQESSAAVHSTNTDTQESFLSDILWHILFFPFSLQTSNKIDSLLPKVSSPDRASTIASIGVGTPPESLPTTNPGTVPFTTSNVISPGREYDLRPYGVGLVVDLGW